MAPPPAAAAAAAALAVGGKDATLTPSSIYAVAAALRPVSIDSAALEKLSAPNKPSKTPPPPPPPQEAAAPPPAPLPAASARAALLLLLSKLLLPAASSRPTLPLLLEQTLALRVGLHSLNFSSASSLIQSLSQLTNTDEISLTSKEIAVLDSSAFASVAISAILDCSVSSLSKLSDVVAALSCEAARAEYAEPTADSLGKFEAEVAGAMKELLHGSKLARKVDNEPNALFMKVPSVHGGFGKAVKYLHDGVREELKATKTLGYEKEEGLLALVSPVAMAIRAMGKFSLERGKAVVDAIGDESLRLKVAEAVERGCPKFEVLRSLLRRFRSAVDEASSRSDYILAFQNVYDAMEKLREMLAWEAALALFALETDESVEKAGPETSVKENGESSKGDKKSRKSKKKTLGKGTSVVRQLLREQLAFGETTIGDVAIMVQLAFGETTIGDVAIMVDWAQGLSLYFDPKHAGLDVLLGKVKDILESNEARRLPKIPKGTRDFGKEQMAIRDRAFSIIVRIFKMHGATALDTPVFELRETLMGKYGEDSKLVYDLADQGGELCSLRYDLTVPFARYLAMNNLNALKRYQVAKVYRRDNPSKGRYREFYQCDFDIAGKYETMEADFEVVKVLTQLLDELNIGDYEIKLNHRKLLDGMLDICGVSSEKFRTVCSSIDKLDKQSFEQIKKELVEEKGLSIETAEMIGSFVSKRGPPLKVLSDLKEDGSRFLENNGSVLALNELEILFKALEKSKCLNKVVFDLSLARGLDYYTGVIFEAIFKGTTQNEGTTEDKGTIQVGSIAAGGRYDNLVGMFSGKQVPAVGVSLGIERVFAIMEQMEKAGNQKIRATETQVLVAILDKDVSLAAELVGELWDAGIAAEYGLSKRVRSHIDRAIDSGIPYMIIVGESEIAEGKVKLKDLEASKEQLIAREDMVKELKQKLNIV